MVAARRTDPDTSHMAAKIDPADLDRLRAKILRTFNRRPRSGWTDTELVEQITFRTPQRVRSARADLTKLGLLRDTDATRLTPSGYRATVRVLA